MVCVGCNPPKTVVIEKVLPACVYVEAVDDAGERMWSGSGVVLEDRVLTAAHVMEGAAYFRILDVDGNEIRYIGFERNHENDFGWFYLHPNDAGKIPHAEIADSNSLKLGEEVIVIGASLGLENFPNITCGVVSGLKRTHEFFGEDFQLQVDAQSWPGNSGGPVFNAKGQVMGLLIGGIWGFDGFSIVVPSELILDAMASK
jgi:S1-C subfamily serine protease